MRGKIGFGYVEVPEDISSITEVWKTHVPSLSFIKYEVDHIYNHNSSKNFSIVLKPIDDKRSPRIICEWTTIGARENYTIKNNIHFSEREACKRLTLHIGDIISGATTNQDVDIDVVNKNMDFLKEYYPELVL